VAQGAAGRPLDPLEPIRLSKRRLSSGIATSRISTSLNRPSQLSAVPAPPPHDRDEADSATPGGVTSVIALVRSWLRGLLGRDHPVDGVRARQQRPAEREQGHEPPVAGG
jgi:hypothetical protein